MPREFIYGETIGRSSSHSIPQKPPQLVFGRFPINPIPYFEVGDPEGRGESVIRREDIAQGVAKGSLPVTTAISRKQWRHRSRETPSFELELSLGPSDLNVCV